MLREGMVSSHVVHNTIVRHERVGLIKQLNRRASLRSATNWRRRRSPRLLPVYVAGELIVYVPLHDVFVGEGKLLKNHKYQLKFVSARIHHRLVVEAVYKLSDALLA